LADKSSGLFVGIENENRSMESNIIMDGATIGDRPIGIANFDVSADLSVPGSEGTVAEFDVLNLQKVSLPRFQFSPALVIHKNGVVGPFLFLNTASSLSGNKIKIRFSIITPSVA
jgi:hypothetical protein